MKIISIIANGSEEIEALTPIDVLRRANVNVDLVSISGLEVKCSHNVIVRADKTIEEINCKDYDGIIIPGGMPGATNISSCNKVVEIIKEYIEYPSFKFSDLCTIKIESKNVKSGIEKLINIVKEGDRIAIRNHLCKLLKLLNNKPGELINYPIFWEAMYKIHNEYYPDDIIGRNKFLTEFTSFLYAPVMMAIVPAATPGIKTATPIAMPFSKSKKNNFILCYTDISDKTIALRIYETEAKSLLLKNDYDTYAKLYGELEEG